MDNLRKNIEKTIIDFLFEEEGNITRNKVLTVGSMMLIMGIIMTMDTFAAHRSHSSHSSHSSHKSHSSGYGGHSSHESHSSHVSHSSSSYGTHSSSTVSSTTPTHTNTQPAHTNNLPSMSGISLKTPPATAGFSISNVIETAFALPDTPKIK